MLDPHRDPQHILGPEAGIKGTDTWDCRKITISSNRPCTAKTLYRKFETHNPRHETARPRSFIFGNT
jgi:hypothetical protein